MEARFTYTDPAGWMVEDATRDRVESAIRHTESLTKVIGLNRLELGKTATMFGGTIERII